MPMQRDLYPPNWEEIALSAKVAANWTCQRCGACHGDRQINRYGQLRKVVLTTAHLNHDPWNPDAALEVMCWPCHARYDAAHRRHQHAMMLIARGQMVLPGLQAWYESPCVRKPRKSVHRRASKGRVSRVKRGVQHERKVVKA